MVSNNSLKLFDLTGKEPTSHDPRGCCAIPGFLHPAFKNRPHYRLHVGPGYVFRWDKFDYFLRFRFTFANPQWLWGDAARNGARHGTAGHLSGERRKWLPTEPAAVGDVWHHIFEPWLASHLSGKRRNKQIDKYHQWMGSVLQERIVKKGSDIWVR